MEIMLGHETLLGTVSRTLRDDFKKSMELTLYLLNIFQAYSNFSEFHEFLITVSSYKVVMISKKKDTVDKQLMGSFRLIMIANDIYIRTKLETLQLELSTTR